MVIVTWNSAGVVGDCIRSLYHTGDNLVGELTVVDNGSSDDTLAVVRAAAPDARIIANGTNLGLPAANNVGIRASASPFLLICNPDVIFRPGALRALVALLERRPQAGWVVPRLLHEDGNLQTSAGDLPRLRDALAGRQSSRRRSHGEPRGFWWDGWDHAVERAVGRGHEAAYLVRRSAVGDVGLQDERYVLDWEGMDWTDRFRRKGWQIWLAPDAEVVHLGGDSIRRVPFRWTVSSHRGMYIYFSDRRPAVWRPVLAVAFGVRAALKLVLAAAGLPVYQLAHRAGGSEQQGPPAKRCPGHDGDSETVGDETLG